jgi:glycosyltransferase involved in cell wall biosynthesis
VPELVVLTEQLLAPVPGGTGRYTRELVSAMAASTPKTWTVAGVTATHRDLSAAAVPDVAGPRALPLPRRALTALWERGVHLWPGGDAVHAPTPLAPPAPRRGRRMVVTVHDTVPFTHPETLTRRGAAWHQAMIQRATQRANAIVVPTMAVAEDLARHAPGPATIAVVPHGVPEAFREDVGSAQVHATETGLDLPDAYVLAVGTVEPRKGLDVLIEAMAKPYAPDLPLVVVGPPGWGEVDLAALAERHGLPTGRLRVLGRISDTDLAVVLRRAAVLAVPSRAEGFGLPVLEAMARGVPVACSDRSSLPEFAGDAALLFDPEDVEAIRAALERLLGDPRLRAHLSKAGRERAAGFSWRRTAELTAASYERALAGRG